MTISGVHQERLTAHAVQIKLPAVLIATQLRPQAPWPHAGC